MTPTDIRDTAIPEDVMEARKAANSYVAEKGFEHSGGIIEEAFEAGHRHATEAARERCVSAFRRIITEYAEDAQPGSEYRLACDDLLEVLSNPAEEKDHD